jgi:hypothetical protein
MANDVKLGRKPALEIWQHPSTAYQLSTDSDGVGYRIFGPKFGGSSKLLIRHELTERDCDELTKLIAEARAALNTRASDE